MAIRRSLCFGLVFTTIFSLTAACSIASGSQRAVNSYLEMLKQDSASLGGEYRCLKGAGGGNVSPTNVRSWDIIGQEAQTDDKYPDSQFNVVYVKITEQNGSYDVTNTWKAHVWDSDELFEHQKRLFSDTDKLLAESNETINQVNQMLGLAPRSQPSSIDPDRSTITSQPYCVTQFVRAG